MDNRRFRIDGVTFEFLDAVVEGINPELKKKAARVEVGEDKKTSVSILTSLYYITSAVKRATITPKGVVMPSKERIDEIYKTALQTAIAEATHKLIDENDLFGERRIRRSLNVDMFNIKTGEELIETLFSMVYVNFRGWVKSDSKTLEKPVKINPLKVKFANI